MKSSWRKLTINLFRKLYNMVINKHNPKCNCGWNMKHYKDSMFISEWICIWNKCGWVTFQTANGKYQWWKRDEKNN